MKIVCLVLRGLVQAGDDVNATNKSDFATALHLSAHRGNHEIVKILLQTMDDTKIRGLHGFSTYDPAIKQSHEACAALLIDRQ